MIYEYFFFSKNYNFILTFYFTFLQLLFNLKAKF
jgi:hypothetical protein